MGKGPISSPCPLCGAGARQWFADHWRSYYRCAACGYVHVPASQHLARDQERAHYELHENRVDDPRYRAFLGRLAEPLLARVRPPAQGLDFGCGPGPALAAMLGEAGLEVALYDPAYQPDSSVFARRWDFITATEVLEHLRSPAEELARLWASLEPGGWLGVMTRRPPGDPAQFANWHYRRDPTHIGFFAAATFEWLAMGWGAELELLGEDVALLKKGPIPISAKMGISPI